MRKATMTYQEYKTQRDIYGKEMELHLSNENELDFERVVKVAQAFVKANSQVFADQYMAQFN
jgi:predicted metalloprotease with PDZ domain